MKIRDVLTICTHQVINKSSVVILGSIRVKIVPGPNKNAFIRVNKKVSIEVVSPNEMTLAGQAVKNFGHIVLRVHGCEGLDNAGSIDGRYVSDVEFECTRLLFQETV